MHLATNSVTNLHNVVNFVDHIEKFVYLATNAVTYFQDRNSVDDFEI